MGQKTHPHGLRVGIHRKWNYSWYGDSLESKNLFFQQRSVEELLKTLLYLYTYTRISSVRCILLVDIKLFKYSMRQVFLFVLFYKFRSTQKRRRVRRGFTNKKVVSKKYIKNVVRK